MHPMRRIAIAGLVLGLVLLFPVAVLAADAPPSGWPVWHLQAAFLGLLAPLALILVAVGATPAAEAPEMVATALAALIVGIIAYAACGFALQFGGLYLRVAWPGFYGLTAEWSPLDPTLGLGWGTMGLRGFFLMEEAATPDAYALAAVQLPAVALAVLIPILALARRVSRGVLIAVAALLGGLLYPLIGNWVWGGGWLALLGLNLHWGHGFVDLGGSATLHVLGASAALAGILIFGRKATTAAPATPVELPPVHLPMFLLMGALFAPLGWLGLILSNPLVTPDLVPGLLALNIILAGLGGAAPSLCYSWLATGRLDALLTARGLIAGLVAGSAACGFVQPWASLLVGFLAGLILPLLLYLVEHIARWHDPNGILATHGVPGLLGALWLALFADGRWGQGWNGVRMAFGGLQQGVAGLLVAPGKVSDVPGQLYAQLTGVGAIFALAFLIPVFIFGLVRAGQVLTRWAGTLRKRRAQLT